MTENNIIKDSGSDRLTAVRRAMFGIALLSFIVLAVMMLLQPVSDPDFWWHLSTGQQIAGNLKLPESDPFTSGQTYDDMSRVKLLLTSYWASQVLYYISFKVMALKGVIAFRALLMGFLLGFTYWRARRQGAGRFISVFTLSIGFFSIATLLMPDRPQTFSFVFASVLLWMTEEIRSGRKPSWLIIPLMLIWANMHAGFIVGIAILSAFLLGSLYEFRRDRGKLKQIAVWTLAGIAASLINPNGYTPLAFMVTYDSSMFFAGIQEYQSTVRAFSGGYEMVAFFWAQAALTAAAMAMSRRRFVPDMLTALLLAVTAFLFIRNITFFSLGMAPMTAYYLQQARERLTPRPAIGLAVRISLVVLMALSSFHYSSRLASIGSPLKRYVSNTYPKDALSFIRKAGIGGRVLNYYDWGGFLIWNLWPESEVFIDGRTLSRQSFVHYKIAENALKADVFGVPEYKYVIDSAHRFDYIFMPLILMNGNMQPLFLELVEDETWIPVYIDLHSYIFVKDNDRNSDIIDRFAVDREKFRNAATNIYFSLMKGAH